MWPRSLNVKDNSSSSSSVSWTRSLDLFYSLILDCDQTSCVLCLLTSYSVKKCLIFFPYAHHLSNILTPLTCLRNLVWETWIFCLSLTPLPTFHINANQLKPPLFYEILSAYAFEFICLKLFLFYNSWNWIFIFYF